MEVVDLSLKAIVPSPTNPRKHFGELGELVTSIVQLGVLQPIVVRPLAKKAGKYECVFGHRRLEASIRAKRANIPAIVREYSDLEVLEAQIVENCHREDIHPLEEADAYHALQELHGYEVQQIADKVGKSKSYIYGRMKLCSLGAKGRKAFVDGKFEASIALLVARIPVEKVQDAALKAIDERRYGDERISYREAADVIQRRFMLALSDAPFRAADATLVPSAGACAVCPKRTGNQAELFPDVKSADVCTDPTCFAAKVDAVWKRRVSQAKADGAKIANQREAGEMRHSGQWRVLDSKDYDTGGKTYRTLLKGHCEPSDITLARDGNEIREYISRSLVDRVLRKTGAKTSRSSSSGSDHYAKQAKCEAEIRKGTAAVAIALVMEKASVVTNDWRFIARGVLRRALSDVQRAVVARRKLEPKVTRKYGTKSSDYEGTLVAIIESGSIEEVQALVVELLVTTDTVFGSVSKNGPLAMAVKAAGGDLENIEAKVKAEIVAAAKAKASKKKPKAKASPGKKKTTAKAA